MNELNRMLQTLIRAHGNDPEEFMRILEKDLIDLPLSEKAHLFGEIGNRLLNLSYFDLASIVIHKALGYFIQNKDKSGEAKCYGNLGVINHSLGDIRKSIFYHNKALKISQQIDDKLARSSAYTNLSIAYGNLGNTKQAIEYNNKALLIKREIGDRAGEALCYVNMGIISHKSGDSLESIDYNKKALEISQDIGNQLGEAICYANLGEVYSKIGDIDRAIKYHKKALILAKELGDRAKVASCYGALGNDCCSLGYIEKALEYHEKALILNRELGNRVGEASCYGAMGNDYYRQGNFKKALELFENALKLYQVIGDQFNESSFYVNIGNVYDSIGDFRRAIECYEKALQIAIEHCNIKWQSSICMNLGIVYSNLGKYEDAIKYHEKALGIVEKFGNKPEKSSCYANIGGVYKELGDSNKAIEFYEKALNLKKEIGDKHGESRCYRNLSIVHEHIGNFWEAIGYNEKALKLSQEMEDRAGVSKSYANLGSIYYNLEDFTKTREYYEKALAIVGEIGDIDLERIVYQNLARLYGDHSNHLDLAYNYCKDAIELAERMSSSLVQEEHKMGFSTRTSVSYDYIIPLSLKLKDKKGAFEYLERAKSRSFLDLLAATEITPSAELTPELESLLKEENNHLIELRKIQIQRLEQSRSFVEPGEIDRLLERLDLIYENIEKFDHEYVFLRKGKPLPLLTLLDMLSSQKRNIVLIEYFITKSEIFIFVISSTDKQLYIETVPYSQKKLIRHFEDYFREVIKYPEFGDIGNSWLALSDYFIDPISKYLHEDSLIYFIPYGILHYLPLHALELNNEPLIKYNAVTYSPSASLISFLQSKGSGKLEKCASFGSSFEDEAESIAKLFNTEIYVGKKATKKHVIKTCDSKDILHFSCHGKFDNEDPLSSGILLDDGVLTAREIFKLKLKAELVTLSACETGINQRNPGDELIGLTRAFLYAGTPSIMVSLWSVDSHSTQELMLEFYRHIKNGLDKATALQEAQKTIMKKEEYSHPFYWAPFVLVGNWE